MSVTMMDYLQMGMINLRRDGYLMPVAFLHPEKEDIAPIVAGMRMNNDEEKEEVLKSLGRLARNHHISRVVIMQEAAKRTPRTKEESKQIMNNYENERPTKLPEGHPDRKEIIVLLNIDMKSGKSEMWEKEYKKESGKIVFVPGLEVSDDGEGLIIDCIMGRRG